MCAATSATENPRSVACLTAFFLNSRINLGVPITGSYTQRVGQIVYSTRDSPVDATSILAPNSTTNSRCKHNFEKH